MVRVVDFTGRDFATNFDRAAFHDDDTASRALLSSGQPVEIVRDDTPHGHVVRLHPDGSEELVKVDRASAAKILGA